MRASDSRTDQPAQRLRGTDIERGIAFDLFGSANTTTYLATYDLPPDELGATIEAPPDETVVTIFLRPKSGDLEPGARLRTPADVITVLIDAGGGARATTSNVKARARVLAFDDDEVCFSLDYHDDHQRVRGTVHADVE